MECAQRKSQCVPLLSVPLLCMICHVSVGVLLVGYWQREHTTIHQKCRLDYKKAVMAQVIGNKQLRLICPQKMCL